MSDISKIDKNFIIDTNIDKENIVFYDSIVAPFKTYGVFWKDGKYRRMSHTIAESISETVGRLSERTAGGRVRFVTDSSFIAISAKMGPPIKVSHFTLAGTSGFDMYADNEYAHTFMPPQSMENGYDGIAEFPDKKIREITLNFPLYAETHKVYIGLEKDSVLKEAPPYKIEKPVVFYGSSITMGGCASRAGNCYENILSRKFSFDYINLGFSGGALGEDEMTEYINSLDMSAFVLDYDHNAPEVDVLIRTHERMFKAIRKEHPDIPIIIMARPQYNLTEDDVKRCEVTSATYKNAIAAGDKNVFYVSHRELTQLCKGEGTVDGIHPNDLGFASMAMALSKIFEKLDL